MFGLEANAAELTRFDKARREASTTCEGLFEGHRFESMAGKAEALFKKGRNEGPPNYLLAIELYLDFEDELPSARLAII